MWYINSIKNNDDKNSCKNGMAKTLSFIPWYANIKSKTNSIVFFITILDNIALMMLYVKTMIR